MWWPGTGRGSRFECILLGNAANHCRQRFQAIRKLIPSRSRDHQPFLRPRHSHVKKLHVLGGLGFRGFDLAEADEEE